VFLDREAIGFWANVQLFPRRAQRRAGEFGVPEM
jgi:hypothetical protein